MDKPNFSSTANRGFTTVELLVTLAVVGVTLAIGLPSMASWAARARLSSLSEDLLVHLHLARSESIKRGGAVVLCKSADGETCTSAGTWSQGWIIFHDADNNGVRGPREAIVQRMGALPEGWRLAGNSAVSRYISYQPSGSTRLASGGFQAGTLTLCQLSAGPVTARQIVLNAAGRPRLQTTTVASCA